MSNLKKKMFGGCDCVIAWFGEMAIFESSFNGCSSGNT